MQTNIDLHVPTKASLLSKRKVEAAIERLHDKENGDGFLQAYEGLKKALEGHRKVLECQKRCENVKKMFKKDGQTGS